MAVNADISGDGGDCEQWVEIIEPQSKEIMFANPITGEIRLQAPIEAIVKPMSQNQWWELYDQGTDRNYYYNAQTEETIWERPSSDSDIIPLSKIQSVPTDDGQPLNQSVEQNGHDPPSGDKRALSQVFAHKEIDILSPLNMDAGKDSSFTYPPTSDHHPTDTSGHNDTGMGSSINDSPGSPRHEVRMIPASPDRGVSTSEEDVFRQQHLSKSPVHTTAHSYHDETDDRESELMKSRTLDLPRSKKKGSGRKRLSSNPSQPPPAPPAAVRPVPVKRKSKSKSPAHVPKAPPPAPPLHKTLSVDTALADKSSNPCPIPVAPPFHPKHPTVSVIPLENFKELATHRTGLFRKKVTIANMLCWTKDSIKRPMIITRDKQQKKEACELFKCVQQYMGDRQGKTKVKELDKLGLTICSKCWQKKGLRDELYIQLCRQTTSNFNPTSLERGWQLFAIALAFFPPTIKFRSYLEGFLWRHVEPSPENNGCPVEVYAQYCHKRVEKMVQWGAKKGLKKPSLEEVSHAKNAPFHPPLFGASLEEVMELQAETHPEMTIPWVVSALCDVVLTLKGPQTEGIFRVPGDIDEVNALKLKVEKGGIPMESIRDPHVPASLLKLWFRELEEPLIPEDYYDDCIANCDHQHNAVSLIESLPDLHKQVLYFLVGFLKNFVTPENIKRTKMGLENIAMVWAPNFLRCPSDDHTLIFQNTRKEMAFYDCY